MYVSMEKTITISDDFYKELLKFKNHRSFSETLAGMITKKGNLRTLELGFGSRNIMEKEMLKAELKKVEEEFQKWI
jgi:predicted CopG family antitoxin